MKTLFMIDDSDTGLSLEKKTQENQFGILIISSAAWFEMGVIGLPINFKGDIYNE